jgi:hypothetical protein
MRAASLGVRREVGGGDGCEHPQTGRGPAVRRLREKLQSIVQDFE